MATKAKPKKNWKKKTAAVKTAAKRPATLEREVLNARQKKEWTQKETAKKIGVGSMFLSNCERGNNRFTPKRFKRISKALDIPIKKLVDLRVQDFKKELTYKAGLR